MARTVKVPADLFARLCNAVEQLRGQYALRAEECRSINELEQARQLEYLAAEAGGLSRQAHTLLR
jgi:hypothetical protein